MTAWNLLCAACLLLPGEASAGRGVIDGIVVNASDGNTPLAGAEVVLQIKIDGQLAAMEETTTGDDGKFRFENLPVGRRYHYLCGANRHDIHYPGPTVNLSALRPRESVSLVVHDSIEHPNPLEIRSLDVVVQPQPGVLKVTETIVVRNPSCRTYVGRPAREGSAPVTLRLSIPETFRRVTFDREFYGRRFSLVGGKLVTDVPFTPGERELRLTYWLPIEQRRRVWQRPLDLPCSHVRVRVHTEEPNDVACNLAQGPVQRHDEMTQLTFESQGQTLPAGHVIRLDLDQLPLPWMAYGRYVASLVLVGLVAGASVVVIKRRRAA